MFSTVNITIENIEHVITAIDELRYPTHNNFYSENIAITPYPSIGRSVCIVGYGARIICAGDVTENWLSYYGWYIFVHTFIN